MPLCSEVECVLKLLDQVQSKMTIGGQLDSTDPKLLSQVNNDLNTLLSVLSNPVFNRLCRIQDSVTDLGAQIVRHPSITTNDFDISPEGKLVLKYSPQAEPFQRDFDKTPIGKTTTASVPVKSANAPLPSSKLNEEQPLTPITTPTYVHELERIIQEAALGREIHTIGLYKPEGSSLGFSVVGLKSQEKGELGIFVQEIQPGGIAARDGRLGEGDQILAIDGQPLDSAITHQQAIGILQQARGEVEIIVARAELQPTPETFFTAEALESNTCKHTIGVGQLPPLSGELIPSHFTKDLEVTDMVLNTEWAQVEVIELINDGTGLGFGIIGGRSTGVVVKTILPGGVADRDCRLQSGDHILQIGEVNLLGMGSEQVAAVLRQCGSCVRLVVARPIEGDGGRLQEDQINALTSGKLFPSAPIVPTKILGDPEELERHLMQSNGYANHLLDGSIGSGSADAAQIRRLVEDGSGTFDSLPEVEIVDVELRKDTHGLGITIAGYVCEKEELSGIFVKSISEGSAADVSGKISINDRIVEVDGQSLQGFTNHQAVEVLRKTGPIVHLKLERYHHGSKYDQLQSAISHSEHKPATPSSVSALSLPQVAVDSDGEVEEVLAAGIGEEDEDEDDEEMTVETRNVDLDLEDLEMLIDTRYEGEIDGQVEAAIIAKWNKIMGLDCDIVVSQTSKAKEGGGLGISLEGTVDVEDGREVRPHHYIRSILHDGPVGRSGKLLSGDELLEVNGRRLLGLNHVEVVGILKDLPVHVRIVCARRPGQPPPSIIDTSSDRNAFAARSILGGMGGSLQNLFQGSDRLVKAKSDGSLASTGTTAAATDTSLSKLKSRSLDLERLAMWSSDPHIIDLPKGDRGLGFSILDYQDPMNPTETVIVIRSLVPGGVASTDGRLIPGDRLLAVNDINLSNASLDQAVQALKGAPRGVVRIVVAKPLPLPDTTTLSSIHSEEAAPPLPVSPPPEAVEGVHDDLLLAPELQLEPDQGMNNQVHKDYPMATERLIPSYRPGTELESGSMSGSTTINNMPALPSALERTIKIKKDEGDALGMNVDVTGAGLNGVIVSSIMNGPIAQDGRINVGDYIVSMNNENLRNVTNNAQVRAILRRAQLYTKDLSISYIPAGDAEVHKATFLIQLTAGSEGNNESYKERVDRVNTRTPADGEESIEDAVGVVGVSSPPSSSLAGPISARSTKVKSGNGSSQFRDQGGSPPSSTSSTKSVMSASLSPLRQTETSKVYISTSDHKIQAPQPQIQKRVVTHVTIFPSPPTEVAQVVTVVKRSDKASVSTTTTVKDKETVTSPTSISGDIPSSGSLNSASDKEESSGSGVGVGGRKKSGSLASQDEPLPSSTQDPSVVTCSSSLATTTTTRVLSVLKIDQEKLSSSATPPTQDPDMVGVAASTTPSEFNQGTQVTSSTKSTQGNSSSEDSALLAKHWGPERLVEVSKEPNKSLGISIVGGKVEVAGHDSGSVISGIFIKNVLLNSPAGKTAQLKTGDRILAVDEVDLRSASHERAVEVIRAAGNPVRFLVQSLVQWSGALGVSIDESETSRSEGTDTTTTTKSQSRISEKSTSSRTKSDTTTTTTSTSDTTSSTTRTVTGTGSSTCSSENGKRGSGSGSGDSASTTTDGCPSQRKRSNVNVNEEEGSDEGMDADLNCPDDGLLKVRSVPFSPSETQ